VIYERGKVIYSSPPQTSTSDLRAPPSVTISARNPLTIWLSPAVADARIRDRVEPEYPAEARAANRFGDVLLKILVRKDGSVASVRTVKGDPRLAAAAGAAVRNWHYEPYQVNGRAKEFQTEVTLNFSLSK
jgi:periplasmic protein TonB